MKNIWMLIVFLVALTSHGCSDSNPHNNPLEGEPDPGIPGIGIPEIEYTQGQRAIIVTWSEHQNASKYNIYKYMEINGEYVSSGKHTLEDTQYVDEDVTQNGRYKYIVEAVTQGGLRGYDSEAQIIFVGICGTVVDSRTGAPIEGVEVLLVEKGLVDRTGPDGGFALPIPRYGVFTLVASKKDKEDYDIYVSTKARIEVAPGEYKPETISLRPIPIVIDTMENSFDSPYYIVFSRDGFRAYVTNNSGHSVTIIEKSNVFRVPEVQHNPIGIAFNPKKDEMYVANNSSYSISVMDAISGEVIETIDVGYSPSCLAVSPDGEWLYSTNSVDENIAVISVDQRDVDDHIPVGIDRGGRKYPYGIAVTVDGKYLWVTNQEEGTVSVLDTNLRNENDHIFVGGKPGDIAISLDGQEIYVSVGPRDGRLVVIDTLTHDIIDDEKVGPNPSGLTVNEEIVYIVVQGASKMEPAGKVKLYDTRKNNMVNSRPIEVGPVPMGMATNGEVFYIANSVENTISVLEFR